MRIQKLIYTIASISGFVPDRMSPIRVLVMSASVVFVVYILPSLYALQYAIAYFSISTILYIGFIFLVLPQKGLRLMLIKQFGEERAYNYYEGFLAFAFFHNGAALTFISQSSGESTSWNILNSTMLSVIAISLFCIGLVTKIWSAYVVGVPIYYWKDMFFGRKITEFVVSGPYKYISNPMYGVGQLQVYAIAIYYESTYGLIFGAVNQALVFIFYAVVEKPFIKRTYFSDK